jgi:hypothetical protein
MSRFLRYLRIAFSATCLIACVLLTVLWVRSYKTVDELHGRLLGQQSLLVGSKTGFLAGIVFQSDASTIDWQWEIHSTKVDDEEQMFHLEGSQGYVDSLGIGWYDHPTYHSQEKWYFGITYGWSTPLNGVGVLCRYWLLVLATALCGVVVAPWKLVSWRFTTCTLLIATTLVAVVLGLAVWAARR